MLIALINAQPRHGYEIMAELTRLFGPRYRASPGSVYPAIDALQTEGLIQGQAVGDKIVYEITAAGEQALIDRAEMLAAVELRAGVDLGHGDSLDAQLTRFKARLTPLSGHVHPDSVAAILAQAAHDIEHLSKPSRALKQRTHHAR